MSSDKTRNDPAISPTRQRLSREDRFRQLIDVSWAIVREEGGDALTLGRLSEKAGITKPVVYDHFGTRNGLLAALYEDYDLRQNAVMDAALANAPATLVGKAGVIATSYVECVLQQGREIQGITAALSGSPELEKIRRAYQLVFIGKCRAALVPFTRDGVLSQPGLWAMLGAADAVSSAAATGDITPADAKAELLATIIAMVGRSSPAIPRIS